MQALSKTFSRYSAVGCGCSPFQNTFNIHLSLVSIGLTLPFAQVYVCDINIGSLQKGQLPHSRRERQGRGAENASAPLSFHTISRRNFLPTYNAVMTRGIVAGERENISEICARICVCVLYIWAKLNINMPWSAQKASQIGSVEVIPGCLRRATHTHTF